MPYVWTEPASSVVQNVTVSFASISLGPGIASRFEHYERNPGCSSGDCFDGTRRRHPKALT